MISVSSGTAGVLGLSKIKQKAPPTTAYIMLGTGCENSCKFCSQSKESNSESNKLSRVDWLFFDEKKIFEKVEIAFEQKKIKRLCLQVVGEENSIDKTLSIMDKIRNESYLKVPVCSSINVKSVASASRFFDAGMDRLCVAMDAASNDIFNQIKGEGYLEKLNLLTALSKKFPGKITTHLIVGLGESEIDMAEILGFLAFHKVTVALFAFTPLKGTAMENQQPPELKSYRKAQVINYLMQNNHIRIKNILHEKDVIKGFLNDQNLNDQKKDGLFDNMLREILINADGLPFMTSGCPDCNRPYYNESTRETPYNYPLRLSKKENIQAINDSELFVSIDSTLKFGGSFNSLQTLETLTLRKKVLLRASSKSKI